MPDHLVIAMPYDKASFLAGIAAGRNMRSWPIREHTEAGVFQFTVWIDQTNTTMNYRFRAHMDGKINWGDGNEEDAVTDGPTAACWHTYESEGLYQITVSGKIYSVTPGYTSTEIDSSSVWFKSAKALISVDTSLPPVPQDAGRPFYISLYRMFRCCENLRVLPLGLLRNRAQDGVYFHSLGAMFHRCKMLEAVPADLLQGLHFDTDGSSTAHSASAMFEECRALSILPEGVFDNEELSFFTNAMGIFRECRSLANIPEGLFDHFTQVTNFASAFYNCRALESLPDGLFSHCAAAADFSSCFLYATSLSEIGNGIFGGCTAAENFQSCFQNTALTTVPHRLFADCVNATRFSSCFNGCATLASVPGDIFENCTKAVYLNQAFYKTALTSIPDGLFDDCTAAVYFTMAFYNCTNLTYVPSGLFQYSTAALYFSACFASENWAGMQITSAVPELWVTHPDAVTKNNCYYGCQSAANYSSIPSDWR